MTKALRLIAQHPRTGLLVPVVSYNNGATWFFLLERTDNDGLTKVDNDPVDPEEDGDPMTWTGRSWDNFTKETHHA